MTHPCEQVGVKRVVGRPHAQIDLVEVHLVHLEEL
jgi:hypothetical protein